MIILYCKFLSKPLVMDFLKLKHFKGLKALLVQYYGITCIKLETN